MAVYEVVHLASSATVKTGPGILHSVVCSGGSGDATLTIFDETSGSGTKILTLTALAGTSVCAVLDAGFGVGLYATLAGTGCKATLTYI